MKRKGKCQMEKQITMSYEEYAALSNTLTEVQQELEVKEAYAEELETAIQNVLGFFPSERSKIQELEKYLEGLLENGQISPENFRGIIEMICG